MSSSGSSCNWLPSLKPPTSDRFVFLCSSGRLAGLPGGQGTIRSSSAVAEMSTTIENSPFNSIKPKANLSGSDQKAARDLSGPFVRVWSSANYPPRFFGLPPIKIRHPSSGPAGLCPPQLRNAILQSGLTRLTQGEVSWRTPL